MFDSNPATIHMRKVFDAGHNDDLFSNYYTKIGDFQTVREMVLVEVITLFVVDNQLKSNVKWSSIFCIPPFMSKNISKDSKNMFTKIAIFQVSVTEGIREVYI